MLIVYDSLTGNVERFVERLKMRSRKLSESLSVDEPYILITYTIGFGEVPEPVSAFLAKNGHWMQAVAVSGNKVWGSNFGRAGDLIAWQFHVPLLLKFELGGTTKDIEVFKRGVESLYGRANTEMAEAK